MQTTRPVTAKSIAADSDGLRIVLQDREILVPWEGCSPRLAGATDAERRDASLSPGGYGVHWPLLDEDLSIAGILRQVRED